MYYTLKEAQRNRPPKTGRGLYEDHRLFRLHRKHRTGTPWHWEIREENLFSWLLPGEEARPVAYAEDAAINLLGASITDRRRASEAARASGDFVTADTLDAEIADRSARKKAIVRRTLVSAWEVHECLLWPCFFFVDVDAPLEQRSAAETTVCWLARNAHLHLQRLRPERPRGGQWGGTVWGADRLEVLRTDNEGKYSCHILSHGAVFPCPESVGFFIKAVLQPEAEAQGVELSHIDFAPYHTGAQMRIAGTHKVQCSGERLSLVRRLDGCSSSAHRSDKRGRRRWRMLISLPDWPHTTASICTERAPGHRLGKAIRIESEEEDEEDPLGLDSGASFYSLGT